MLLGRLSRRRQLYDLFKQIDMTKEVFEYETFTRPETVGVLDTDQADRSSVLPDQ